MTVRSNFGGHPVSLVDDDWQYEDGTSATHADSIKPCKKCRKRNGGYNNEDPDPCLGRLPGVKFACCGHGNREDAYILFDNGLVVQGFDKIKQGEESK